MNPEKGGKFIPVRPPAFPSDDVADTVGITVLQYISLSVVVS